MKKKKNNHEENMRTALEQSLVIIEDLEEENRSLKAMNASLWTMLRHSIHHGANTHWGEDFEELM